MNADVEDEENVDQLTEYLTELQVSSTHWGTNITFILWTKEQQKIISSIGTMLLSRSSKAVGCEMGKRCVWQDKLLDLQTPTAT
jgi:hypothetical protein